ncbi:MAG: hypothetical protein ACOYXT_19270 [Bacteroidota bacterium]
MEVIKEKVEYLQGRVDKVIQNYLTQPGFEDWHLSALTKLNSELGFLKTIEHQFHSSKAYFYVSAKIDIVFS